MYNFVQDLLPDIVEYFSALNFILPERFSMKIEIKREPCANHGLSRNCN